MRLLALAALAGAALAARSRSRAADAVTDAELDVLPNLPAHELDERFLLTTITHMTVTDGPSSLLNKSEIDSWTQTAHYASAIRCDAQELQDWSCPHCVDEAHVLATGGNDGSTPLWYVANNGTHIIVSLAGTNTRRLQSVNTNLQFLALPPIQDHFPNTLMGGVRLHAGYYGAFLQIHGPIHDAIRSEREETTTGEIVVTGHSLGGAVGSILAVWLLNQYPGKVTGRFFAPPRQGNQAWADYVDKQSQGRIQHMNNFNDIVPHLPPRVFDYRHYGHEVYITSWGGEEYVSCPGQENKKCAGQFLEPVELIKSLVPHLDAIVHSGPYAGVMMGCVGDHERVGDAGEAKDSKVSSAQKDEKGQPITPGKPITITGQKMTTKVAAQAAQTTAPAAAAAQASMSKVKAELAAKASAAKTP